MRALSRLSVIYLLCASWFTVAIAFDRDPALERASRAQAGVALAALESYVVRPGIARVRDGTHRLIVALYPSLPPAEKTAHAARSIPENRSPRRQAHVVFPPAHHLVPHNPHLVSPALSSSKIPEFHIAAEARPAKIARIVPRGQLQPKLALVPKPPSRPSPSGIGLESLSPAELVRVSSRLKESLTREMLDNFSLFLYVSKAENGPWSQRLYVFRKGTGSNLSLLYNWSASTGREKYEIAPDGSRRHTVTPGGYYEIDPSRMYQTHFSSQWHEPMPYAMFFNWENHGYLTGLAIHGAVGLEVSQLGMRASAGCIRLAPENAQLLFGLIRAEYRGLAPRFAFDQRTATMSNNGVLMHDPAGNLKLAEGYKVLVFVEDYGGQNVVAALF